MKEQRMTKIIIATTVPQSLDTFLRGVFLDLSKKYEVIALSSPEIELNFIHDREKVRTISVPMNRHISIIKDCVALWRMMCVFMREKPTMVHSLTPKAGLLCMLAAWITRVPVRIHTFTGLVFPSSTGLQRRLLMLTDSITCACATNVIPEGEGVKSDLLSYGITKKPMRVLGYGNVRGVDMKLYSRRPEVQQLAKAIEDKSFFSFLFVGRVVRDKGVNELIASFERLSTEAFNTRLWLIGPFEDSLDPISDQARRVIFTNPNIIYLGSMFDDELLAYYAASDCLVLPSYREGFPNTVLEAGAMGLPAIVTDINGSREIISEGENGLIIPPRDEDALYFAMKKMINNEKARKYMASNARMMIKNRYEQGFVRQCLFNFYNEVLSSKTRITM